MRLADIVRECGCSYSPFSDLQFAACAEGYRLMEAQSRAWLRRIQHQGYSEQDSEAQRAFESARRAYAEHVGSADTIRLSATARVREDELAFVTDDGVDLDDPSSSLDALRDFENERVIVTVLPNRSIVIRPEYVDRAGADETREVEP